jgi:RNA polymerase sigma-70 factor (ECF subfamily)
MPDGAECWTLEQYRAYLRIRARMKLSPELCAALGASDLVQMTMLSAWQKRDQFRGQTTAEYLAWLRRILANEAYDQAKQEGLIGDDPVHKLSLEAALEESGARLDALLALDSSPPAKLIERERLVLLDNALEQLPAQQRQAVELHKLQGLTIAETAARMDLSKPAVAGLYARALRTLRGILTESP